MGLDVPRDPPVRFERRCARVLDLPRKLLVAFDAPLFRAIELLREGVIAGLGSLLYPADLRVDVGDPLLQDPPGDAGAEGRSRHAAHEADRQRDDSCLHPGPPIYR